MLHLLLAAEVHAGCRFIPTSLNPDKPPLRVARRTSKQLDQLPPLRPQVRLTNQQLAIVSFHGVLNMAVVGQRLLDHLGERIGAAQSTDGIQDLFFVAYLLASVAVRLPDSKPIHLDF